jgi:hypothetical protein
MLPCSLALIGLHTVHVAQAVKLLEKAQEVTDAELKTHEMSGTAKNLADQLSTTFFLS